MKKLSLLCIASIMPLAAIDQKEKDYLEILQRTAKECTALANDRQKRMNVAAEFSINHTRPTISEIANEAHMCEENAKNLKDFLAQLAKKNIASK